MKRLLSLCLMLLMVLALGVPNSVDAASGGRGNVAIALRDALTNEPISGVTITLYDENDNEVQQIVTTDDPNVNGMFTNVPDGWNYIRSSNLPEGYILGDSDDTTGEGSKTPGTMYMVNGVLTNVWTDEPIDLAVIKLMPNLEDAGGSIENWVRAFNECEALVARIAGSVRTYTAALVSQITYPTGAPYFFSVFDNPASMLSAAAYFNVAEGPMLVKTGRQDWDHAYYNERSRLRALSDTGKVEEINVRSDFDSQIEMAKRMYSSGTDSLVIDIPSGIRGGLLAAKTNSAFLAPYRVFNTSLRLEILNKLETFIQDMGIKKVYLSSKTAENVRGQEEFISELRALLQKLNIEVEDFEGLSTSARITGWVLPLEYYDDFDTVIVANHDHNKWSDLLSSYGLATHLDAPIYIHSSSTNESGLSPWMDLPDEVRMGRVIIVGGPASISNKAFDNYESQVHTRAAKYGVEPCLFNPNNPGNPITIPTQPTAEVILNKTNSQTGQPVEGARFMLYSDGTRDDYLGVSDASGVVKITGVEYGQYRLREISAPDGYILDGTDYDVTVDATGVTFNGQSVLTVTNEPDGPPVYKVTHEFVSGTPDATLPQSVLDLVPADQLNKEDGTIVTPTQPTQTVVTNPDGTRWEFRSYDRSNAVINGADEHFVGTWDLISKYKVTHEFESTDPNRPLPQEVLDLLPPDQPDKENGETVRPTPPAQTVVEVEDGRWEFKEYDRPEDVIDNADEHFIGEWVFVPKYKVTHEFESSDPNRPLPQEVLDLLPPDQPDKENGETVRPTQPTETVVEVEDGRWEFKDYDRPEDVIDNADENFPGVWEYVPYYEVTHEFESSTPGKDLPQEVLDLLPPNQTKKENGETVTPTQPTETVVEVEDGDWVFEDYDRPEDVIDNDDVNFPGTWKFEPVYKVIHEFVSGTPDMELPQEVLDLLPEDQLRKKDGETVNPTQPTETVVEVEGGSWLFVEYDRPEDVIDGADELFTGTWVLAGPNMELPETGSLALLAPVIGLGLAGLGFKKRK